MTFSPTDTELPSCFDTLATLQVMKYSVQDESISEIEKHKWIASQQAGYDLGEIAVREWIRLHWFGYLRAKWLEHLQGTRYWIELDLGDYGFLRRAFPDDRELLNQIVEQLKNGKENLDLFCWAWDAGILSERVLKILESLNINSRRLRHKFEIRCIA